MQQNTRRNVTLGITLLIAILIATIGYFVYTQITRTGKIPVSVVTAPRDAEITIDNEKIGNGTAYLVPDHTYTVKVHKEGFEDVTQKQYISSDEDSITVNLEPVSDEAKKWAEKHEDQYSAVESQAGAAADKEGGAMLDKSPIIDVLPDESLLYSIGYRADPSDPSGNGIIISIEASEGARNAAIQRIRDLGYEPTDYKIEFSDYRNPFAL